MFPKAALIALSYLAIVSAQQVGTLTTETHPSLPWYKCTTAGGCVSQAGEVTIDANWRWTHSTSGSTNCYTGNTWDATLCPDDVTCAANCALDGADYANTYGVTVSGDALTLKLVTESSQKNVGSRLYLMSSDSEYEIFKLVNQEFTFDVDVSNLPCGLNGALYFSEMDADGGMAKYPTNKAGAKYGTGYCDSQCPQDLKFIAGEANVQGWTPDSNSANSGTGNNGACCNEMDIWEANSISAAVTPHPCSGDGLQVCSASAGTCTSNGRYDTVCDPDGCDFNSYRMGDTSFYGPGLTVDTNQKFTVVTQFISSDGTATGDLTEIRRIYIQNGVVIQNSFVNVPGITANTYNSITEPLCDAQKAAFGDQTAFQAKGGLTQMGVAGKNGMVLVLSIWDDYAVNMLWLDSDYPTTSNATAPGVARGTCATTSGVAATVEADSPNASVTYSNIRFGDIGSTYSGTTSSSSSAAASSSSSTTTTKAATTVAATSTSSAAASTATQVQYGQCGGIGWTGPTVCATGTTCQVNNAYYSQCH
ncbi:Exoglucanase [Blastosporella zonata]|nr:Exoglucanase [Blastosporella zonata]